MHPIRLLAKLATKTSNLQATGSRATNSNVMDWTMAAHALSGLPQNETDWALYRFAGHDDKLNKIVRALTMLITLYVKINRYKIKPETLDGIVKAAILEYTTPACGQCSGSGWVEVKNEQLECPRCHGHGRKLMSNNERCRVIGIANTSYRSNHDRVTKELIKIISDWETKIIKNVREKMGDVA